MNGFLFLVALCALYYCLWRYYPHVFERRHHIYMGIFVASYSVLYYLMVFEEGFMRKIFQNIYDSSQQPLYTQNSQRSNASLYQTQHPQADLKDELAGRQGSRCVRCQNYLMGASDVNLTYLQSLSEGGANAIENLGVQCTSCAMFS